MKKFTIPCLFAGVQAPFSIYVGEPVLEPADAHPIEQQAAWLLRERGGVVPEEVMDSFMKLLQIAKENNVSFEELCVYALGTASGEASSSGDAPDSGDAAST
ncbi:DUF2610 domain-containing protein [Actinospica durhamensis]|uniref:DUF2610 domain-containing protein n=1 Tax=Actinospica durhamensis TaxID=1508375 RepID=UPI0027DB5805|nr:DUF2610 domain-containing protein [Actinospica durhamensis]